MFINKFFQYKLHHLLAWASAFFLWREYYRVVDPPQMAWIFASICTFFACITFYFTYYNLASIVVHKGNALRFLVTALLSLAILASLRSACIYLAFEIMLPDRPYWRFFNSITASSFHVGYAITIATLFRLFIDRYETQKKLDAIARDNLRTELNYLRSQVNPHFLFNIHNNIYFLIQENPAKAADILLKLSDLMKYQLYDCNKERVLLGNEINHIRNYIELEKMRIEEVVRVDFVDAINDKGQPIAPFLFLSIIENAFKHVSQDASRKNEIVISFSQQNGWINLEVKNTTTGTGIENGTGLGLKNAKRRLELLYPGKHELHTHNSDGRYIATMKIML